MKTRILQALQILAVRVVPGAINVGALFVLATLLSAREYGLASTYIATSGAASNFLFGPIIQPAIVGHSEHSARGEQQRFERDHATNSLLLAGAVTAVGCLLAWSGLFGWRIVVATAAFGLYTSIQEISHARVEFVRFAIGSTAQSVAFLLLVFLMLKASPTVDRALEAYTISYLIGAVASAGLIGIRFARPSFRTLRTAFEMGSAASLSNGASSFFTLGCRYLLIALGHLEVLGVLAFSVDLAQKTVGVFINFATFAVVPYALRKGGSTDIHQLWRSLKHGWLAAASVSMMSAVAIVILGLTHWITALNRPVYDPISFILISFAVLINRTSKMMLTPIAMRQRQTSKLLIPFAFISPMALSLVAGGMYLHLRYAAELGYLAAFGLWAASSYWLLAPNRPGRMQQ